MPRDERKPVEALLDWHLDRIDDGDRSWIETALHEDQALRAASDRLEQVLRPLDDWTVDEAPPDLVDRVLSRVERAARSTEHGIHFPSQAGGAGRPRLFALRDVLAVAACIALLVGVFVPGVSVLRSESQRAMCAGHLSSIFRGTSAYRQASGGSLPFAGHVSRASWLPGGASGRPYASNSRHLYLLVKLNYGPQPADFVCPGCAKGDPMPAGRVQRCDDFRRVCNNSYASLNLAGLSPNLRPRGPLAYVADANPLFVDARFDASVDPDRTNSPAHGGRGQMVLTLDGAARWMTTPITGANHDNLWLAGNIRRYTGVEVPTRNDDAHLVPGFPTTDPLVRHRQGQQLR